MGIIDLFDSDERFARLGPRKEAFRKIIQHLEKQESPFVIVETGTARAEDAWEGDGQSTLIWDWYVKQNPSRCLAISIDISKEACAVSASQTEFVKIECRDSVTYLNKMHVKEDIKLLFLDSWDWTEQGNFESAFHHLAELAAVWSHLPKGCMIAVDDCHAEDHGKHWLVANFFLKLGCLPIHEGYITLWKKY